MSYVVRKKNGEKLLVLADQEVNGDYGVTFTGRRVNSYGEIQQDNFLWLMENFAGTTAPTNPVLGQLWYDTASGVLKVCTKSSIDGGGNSDTWVKLLQNSSSDEEPETVDLETGDLWYDVKNKVLKVFDESVNAYQIVGPTLKSNHHLYKDAETDNTTDGTQAKQVPIVAKIDELKGACAFRATVLACSSTKPEEYSAMWVLEGLIYVNPTAVENARVVLMGEVSESKRCSKENEIFNSENLNWYVKYSGGSVNNTSKEVMLYFVVNGRDISLDPEAHVRWTINMDVIVNNI